MMKLVSAGLLVVCSLVALCCSGMETTTDTESLVSLLEFVIDVDEATAGKCLATLRERVQSGEVSGERLDVIRKQLQAKLAQVVSQGPDAPLYMDALLLSVAWRDPHAQTLARQVMHDATITEAWRIAALESLAAARDRVLLESAGSLLLSVSLPASIKARLLGALGSYDDASVATHVLRCYPELEATLQPQAIELLTQRSTWSLRLLQAIQADALPTSIVNVNQIRKLLTSPDKQVAELARGQWGAVRVDRNPEREQVIDQMRELLSSSSGNPYRGREVFGRVCGQCHRIYGTGQDVGPEITRNGRGTFEQLLSNVFDPSLVIGAAYQARTVITADGRVLTGLLSEDSEQRIVLKTQGGKLEIVARDDVDGLIVSQLSLMPEGLEKQLTPQQIADLFAFLVLDQPPENADAASIAGTPPTLIGN